MKSWKGNSWSFPRGKINSGELDEDCAIREVIVILFDNSMLKKKTFEETGVDISSYIHSEEYIEVTIREQNIRLYIAQGVSIDTELMAQTRNEISVMNFFIM